MGLFSLFFSKPHSAKLTVTSGNGFHLRPVAKFVATAKQYQSDIQASFQGKSADAKGVNALLSLSLEQGDTFTVTVKGKDAEKALEALSTLFHTLMQDDVEVSVVEKEETKYESKTIAGDIIASGIAIGPATRYQETQTSRASTLSFEEAFQKSEVELNTLNTLYADNKEKSNADIYLAQKELLSSLKAEVTDLASLEKNIADASSQLRGTKLEAKIVDYKDILQRIKAHLGMTSEVHFPTHPFILMADDLLPSQIEILSHTSVQAVILKETSLNSHTAILLRGAGLPSLIADYTAIEEESQIILDAHAGLIVLEASEKELEAAHKRKIADKEAQHSVFEKRFEAAKTQAGKSIKVLANVTDPDSARTAKEEGAEGIGLLRTEFLFKKEQPAYEKQVEAYKAIFAVFDDVTVRTLDVGGDKALPYITLIQEDNPFLGIRGVRLFNTHPEIIAEQLHAIFSAAQNRAVKIMFPMVSSVEEFMEAKAFAQNVAKEYEIDISNIHFGIMIEVPSVLFLLEDFNKVVDFYSIGTNDLTQYLFAIERTHATLKTNDLSPALFDALALIVSKAEKPVSICGELAANTEAIPKLLDIGLETLSVSARRIAETKKTIREQ